MILTYKQSFSHTHIHTHTSFVNGYCSTLPGLLDCFAVDLGFTELSFIQIGLCVLCVSPPPISHTGEESRQS